MSAVPLTVAATMVAALLDRHCCISGLPLSVQASLGFSMSALPRKLAAALLKHWLLHASWDAVADGNGLLLLHDNVHLSDRGALIVAGEVQLWMQQPLLLSNSRRCKGLFCGNTTGCGAKAFLVSHLCARACGVHSLFNAMLFVTVAWCRCERSWTAS